MGVGVGIGCGLWKVLLLVELEAVGLMAEVFGPVFGGFISLQETHGLWRGRDIEEVGRIFGEGKGGELA